MKSVLFLFFVFLSSTNAFAQWASTSGPIGAKSNEIFFVENYLFVNGYDGGVYRSDNKGKTWESVKNGLPVDSRIMAMDVENNKLYLSTIHGIYLSDDFGNSWRALTDTNLTGFSIEVSGDEIFVGSSNNRDLQYSADGGATWERKSSSATQESVLHLLKWENTLWLGTSSKFYRSTDKGTSWSPSAPNVVVSSLDSADSYLFVSGNDHNGFFGVYRSGNNGASWVKILSTQETNIPVSGFLKIGNTLYVSGFTSLYYSDDDGLTWTTQLLPESFNFRQQTFMTHVDDELFVSYGDGILFTADRGATWERRNIDYKNHTVIQLSGTNQSIVSLSEDNGVSISRNDGASWKWIPDHDPYRPRQIYAHDNSIVVSYLLGLYKSEDEGETWKKIFTLTDDIPGAHAIPDVYLTGWKETLLYCTYKGVYFSKDMGISWDLWPISNFATDSFIFKSFIKGDTAVLVTEKELFFSTNLGATWKKQILPEGLIVVSYYSITDMLFDESYIMLSTSFGLYKSTDFGISWKRSECIPERIIFDMEEVGGTVLLNTFSGVYASQNGGGWYAIRDGLEGARTLSMTIKGQVSFVGTWGKSVWKRPLSDLLTPGENLTTGAGVPKPHVEHTCSSITVVNATPQLLIKWYKDGALIPNETGTTIKTKGEGRYHVSFENSCDLKISDEVTLGHTQTSDLEIYNVVTANGDGKNDYYFVDDNLIGSRLNVYNRWGEIIYSNPSYQNNWSPAEISGGQYFYRIDKECFGVIRGVLTILKP
jgi:photosystem II stability/assembly factor-like uncharacterized protein